VLGLGSPTHPLPRRSYTAWCSTYRWTRIYGYEYLYAGPLFIHQLPQVWVDFRGVQDAFMRSKESDYFENSRRATDVQREYAIRNPREFAGYGFVAARWAVELPASNRVRGVGRAMHSVRERTDAQGWKDATGWTTLALQRLRTSLYCPLHECLHELPVPR
jgi:hypothetical protein